MTDAELIKQAIDAMRADSDSRWHAVADLLAGGPLSYARLGQPDRYPDAARGTDVARAYLGEES